VGSVVKCQLYMPI